MRTTSRNHHLSQHSVEVNAAIAGTQRLLDVGNGGVFDYDTQLVPEIVGVDLFLDELTAGPRT